MHCSEFLELYSDHRDGLIADRAQSARIGRHLEGCTRCMEYDARISRGVIALKATHDIEPSAHFLSQLDRRLARTTGLALVDEPVPVPSAGIMVAIMLLAALALAITELGPSPRPAGTPTQVSASPLPPFTTGSAQVPLARFAEMPTLEPTSRVPGPSETSFEAWLTLSR